MKLSWDEKKRKTNLAKHGVDFALVEQLDWDWALTVEQPHESETRHLTFAPIGDRLFVLVWTQRGDSLRVISLRKANKREVAKYDEATED